MRGLKIILLEGRVGEEEGEVLLCPGSQAFQVPLLPEACGFGGWRGLGLLRWGALEEGVSPLH